MAVMPGALLRLLPENATAPFIDPRILIYHSIVGPGSAAYNFFIGSTGLESTFINPRSDEPNGQRMWQLMDTTRKADANLDANRFAVSVETGDYGHPDNEPWDAGQIRRNIETGIWVTNTHPKVRRIRCTAWDGTGIGFHSMWGAPSPWTPSRGKTCPGRARIVQFERQVLPAILADAPPGTIYIPPGDDMTPTQAAQLEAAAKGVAEIRKVLGDLPRKPVAVRMAATRHGKIAGEVWVVTPAGCYHVTRAALDLLKISGQVVEHPTPVDPGYLESLPVLQTPTAAAAG